MATPNDAAKSPVATENPALAKSSPQEAAEEHSKYPDLRAAALEQRKRASPGETPAGMRELYTFWSDILVNKFNVRMYEDFRACALEDSRREPPSEFGIRCLLAFYDKVLKGERQPLPAAFYPHLSEAQTIVGGWPSASNGNAEI